MVNIAEVINEISTIKSIDLYYESNRIQRRRLGLSQAGHDCFRYLYYKFNGFDEPEIDGRILRLFELGNLLENQTIQDLRGCGFEIHSQQKAVEIEYNGIKLTGSIDGIVEGLIESPSTPHLFEHKTASKKKYDELLKKRYKEWNSLYFWQVQFYMLSLKLKRAAVFVYCKDDSRLYFERIKLEKEKTIDRLIDVFDAISKDSEPEKICESSEDFKSKFCEFREVCWK